MSIPGYGAEASLYRSAGHYRAAMMAAGLTQPVASMIPQQTGFSLILPPFCSCYPRICVPGGAQYCCCWSAFGHRCFIHTCPPFYG